MIVGDARAVLLVTVIVVCVLLLIVLGVMALAVFLTGPMDPAG